jgi:hypothetical protein
VLSRQAINNKKVIFLSLSWFKKQALKSRHQKNKEKDHLLKIKKQHQKEFFANLKKVCNQLAGYDLYAKIPVDELELIYNYRIRQISIVADDQDFKKKELNELTALLVELFNTNFLELTNNRGQIALGLLLIEGHTLAICFAQIKDHESATAREIRELMNSYLQEEFLNKQTEALMRMFLIFSISLSDFRSFLLQAKMDLEPAEKGNVFRYNVKVNKVIPAKETFVVDGHPRPAFRVCWPLPLSELILSSITLHHLPEPSTLPVYIQSHALLRLEERMGLPHGPLHYYVYAAIRQPHYHVDEHDHILIDYAYLGKKTGYLVASVEKQRLLIHTFLFITANGTPEGKKLSQLTGLKKMDMKYLAIDKLSTFLNYKIQDHPFVKTIFEEAGCGHLLTIDDTSTFLYGPPKAANVETLAKYLQVLMPKS